MARDTPAAVAYVPFKTFLTSLDTLRQGIPDTLDRSVFGNQSGSTQGMLLSSYKALGLVDDQHHPEPILYRLVDPSDRKTALKEILEVRYEQVIELGLAATQKQFDDQMASYGVGGDTKKKAKSFFIQAAEMAGIPLSPYITPGKPGNGASPRPTTIKRRVKPKAKPGGSPPAGAGSGETKGSGRLHPAVQAWIDEMPSKDEDWDRDDFDSWLAIFKASIERAYKI